MAIAKLGFHANAKRKKTRMAIAKLFAFHVNAKILVACCLNNFYGCYALLCTF